MTFPPSDTSQARPPSSEFLSALIFQAPTQQSTELWVFNGFSSPMFNFLRSPNDNMVRFVTAMIDSLVTSSISVHLFFDVTKYHDQNQCGEEGAYYSLAFHIKYFKGSESRNSREESECLNWSREHGGWCLALYSFWFFFHVAHNYMPKGSITHSGLALPSQSLIQKCLTGLPTGQFDGVIYSAVVPPSQILYIVFKLW